MGRRVAVITEADIKRVIRALDACGKRFGRVRIGRHDVIIETDQGEAVSVAPSENYGGAAEQEIVL